MTNTPVVLTADEFISIGDGNQSSCTQSFSTDNNNNNKNNTVANNSPNSDLIVGVTVGVSAGLIALLALVVTTLQLLVTHKKLPEGASPWPLIRESFRDWCCCCTRRPRKATKQVDQEPGVALVAVDVP